MRTRKLRFARRTISGGSYKRFLEARARRSLAGLSAASARAIARRAAHPAAVPDLRCGACRSRSHTSRAWRHADQPASRLRAEHAALPAYLSQHDGLQLGYLSLNHEHQRRRSALHCRRAVEQNGITIAPFLAIEESDNLNETLDSLFSGWKSAANTNGVTLKCFNYISPNAPTFNSAGGNCLPWYNNALIFSSMFAYTSASGSGTTDLLPYSGAPDQSFLQTCLTNAQTVSASYSQNGKTAVLAGASAWDLPAQYFVDVYYNGLATSKYGEASAPPRTREIDGFFQDNSAPVAPRTDSGIAATWNGLGTTPPVLLDPEHTGAVPERGWRLFSRSSRACSPCWC